MRRSSQRKSHRAKMRARILEGTFFSISQRGSIPIGVVGRRRSSFACRVGERTSSIDGDLRAVGILVLRFRRRVSRWAEETRKGPSFSRKVFVYFVFRKRQRKADMQSRIWSGLGARGTRRLSGREQVTAAFIFMAIRERASGQFATGSPWLEYNEVGFWVSDCVQGMRTPCQMGVAETTRKEMRVRMRV